MKLKSIVLAVILLLTSVMMPFNDIYAETVSGDSPIIGVNISYRDYAVDHEPYQLTSHLEMPDRWQCVSSHSSMGCQVWSSQDTTGNIQDEITGTINVTSGSWTDVLYEYEFILDKSYVGYIYFSTPIGTTNVRRYFVNGTSFTITSTQLITTFTVEGYQLEYAPLETTTKLRQWNVPLESLSAVYPFVSVYSSVDDFYTNNYYQFPIFVMKPNDFVYYGAIDYAITYDYIFICNNNLYSSATLYNNLIDNTLVNIKSFKIVKYNFLLNGSFSYIIHLKISGATSPRTPFTIKNISNNDISFIPIYFSRENDNKYISTDFALQFGLSNQLLDDLHIIANGTTQSSSAASDLESGNSQMADDMDDLATIENGYNDQFNNQLQQIDFSSPLQSNAGILPAANFVITIFNGLINNNPFSVLIIIVCILLIGKKVIGK